MPSQYQHMKENYDKYMSRILHNPAVAREMRRQMQYANTIDPDVANEAARLLSGNPHRRKTGVVESYPRAPKEKP